MKSFLFLKQQIQAFLRESVRLSCVQCYLSHRPRASPAQCILFLYARRLHPSTFLQRNASRTQHTNKPQNYTLSSVENEPHAAVIIVNETILREHFQGFVENFPPIPCSRLSQSVTVETIQAVAARYHTSETFAWCSTENTHCAR